MYGVRFLFIEVVVAVAVLLAVAFVVVVFGYTGFWVVRNWFAPIRRVHAVVERRRSDHWDVPLTGISPTMGVASLGLLGRCRHEAARAFMRLAGRQELPEVTLLEGTNLFVTYSFEGKEVEFSVPMAAYQSGDEGVDGLLVYKGEKFKRFIPRVR